jgi:hypothetical protein
LAFVRPVRAIVLPVTEPASRNAVLTAVAEPEHLAVRRVCFVGAVGAVSITVTDPGRALNGGPVSASEGCVEGFVVDRFVDRFTTRGRSRLHDVVARDDGKGDVSAQKLERAAVRIQIRIRAAAVGQGGRDASPVLFTENS